MTITAIEQRAAAEAAKAIRQILDEAVKAAGDDDVEQEILDLVTEEE